MSCPNLRWILSRLNRRSLAIHNVFASRGSTQLQNHTVGKAVFVAKLPDMPQWQLHDLRRTAKSLMARAGMA